MKVIKTVSEMQKITAEHRLEKKTIGVVPTMGALHYGHLSLIKKARLENDTVIVTIFINPKQFGPKEDYLRYPRPFKKDSALCYATDVDYVFAPSVEEMYPDEYLTYLEVKKLSEILCGKCRPGHFVGVVTVVCKLFNITQPDRAYFGEKDFQQLKIIQKMVCDLNFPIKIVPCKTEREKTGLAISSRNVYLTKQQYQEATKIYQALNRAGELIITKKIKNTKSIISYIKKIIGSIPESKIEYIKICDSESLVEQTGKIHLPLRILVAVRVGKTRLIDNIEVG